MNVSHTIEDGDEMRLMGVTNYCSEISALEPSSVFVPFTHINNKKRRSGEKIQLWISIKVPAVPIQLAFV